MLIQILFKHVALGPGGSSYLALARVPIFYLCLALFMAQTAAWLAVLRRMPLSRAYPFTSLTVVTVLFSGAVIFGEAITMGHILGTLVIMGGIVTIASDQSNQPKVRM